MKNREETGLFPDNHDHRLKYYELLLEQEVSGAYTETPLPEGYRFVWYQDGDKKEWKEIEYSAKELISSEEGERCWEQYYAGKEEELLTRMLFIETDAGEKIATATAFYEPRDPDGAGWLHWVSIKREYQGKGLARPLISRALNRLVELGYTKIKIPTQTTTWVAVRLYLSYGFRPIPKNAISSQEGYQIIRTLTGMPCLMEFPILPMEEIWDPQEIELEHYMKETYGDAVRYRWKRGVGRILLQIDGIEREIPIPDFLKERGEK